MDPKRTKSILIPAILHGAKRGWDLDFSRGNRRLTGLLLCFQGYCVAFIAVLSLIAVAFGRNVTGNLEGAAIMGFIAFVLIKLGRFTRRSAIRP